LTSGFVGTAGYTSTFVAQYVGAGRPERAALTVWQGIYFSLAAGLLLSLFILIARPLFALAGHAPHLQVMEVTYFTITCPGAVFVIVASAIAGFFIGRGDTKTVMAVHSTGFGINALLDYLLIFGKAGIPRLGIAGAAWATVAASASVAVLFFLLYLRRSQRVKWGTWQSRRFDGALACRLLRYGFPNGMRFSVEMLAWTVFIFFAGRIGPLELAATTIAWRINGIAFFPVIGFSQAIAIMVGTAQGAGRPEVSLKVTWRGAIVSQAWMLALAALFLMLPHELFAVFNAGDSVYGGGNHAIAERGVVLLRFVALYCLLDAFNYIFMGTLVAAGDTRWTLIVSTILHALFITALFASDHWCRTLMAEWTIATVFVMVQALFWLGRFLQGRWKHLQVIEPVVVD
ncbi:MAG: MATE family efflux transporter, partial [Chitinispirillaceae bacterium]|nr:MATE family efflux transporter [Chitinispirillaceae bacterium]